MSLPSHTYLCHRPIKFASSSRRSSRIRGIGRLGMTWFTSCFRTKAASPIPTTEDSDDAVSGFLNVRRFGYRELRLATQDFSPANKIGAGGFGSVYKGTLRDGSAVAVKVLSGHSRQGIREFLAELSVISVIEHPNLVKLYGCCVDGDQRILVYGYLENNSLAKTLLERRWSGNQFSWKTRSDICIGVGRGLAFLHDEVHPHIVHRDIKASNILLDRDLTPKISDFGLAKIIPDGQTHVSTRVAGTTGYLAPEYAITGKLTRKADIYSFGVLLLEIVSGRSNTDTRPPYEEEGPLERAWGLHREGELVDVVDESLNGDFDMEEARRFLKVGLLCTQEMPKSRPTMSTVVGMLTGEVEVEEEMLIGIRFGGAQRKLRPESPGEMKDSSSSSMPTSVATMTFNSIYDRSG